MSQQHRASAAEVYVKLFIAIGAFGMLSALAYLHVADNGITVPTEFFLLFISILGTMLGVDILRDVRERDGRR